MRGHHDVAPRSQVLGDEERVVVEEGPLRVIEALHRQIVVLHQVACTLGARGILWRLRRKGNHTLPSGRSFANTNM